MQSERPHPWLINVHAKAKYFDFKFEVAGILPPWKPSPSPIKVKLCPPLLKSRKSEPQLPFPRKIISMKSKFLQILGKLRPRSSKTKAITSRTTSNFGHFPVNQPRQFAYEEPICVISLVVGFFTLLCQSISQKDQKGIILYSLIFLLHLVLILNRFITRKTRNLLVIVIVAMLGCAIGIYFRKILRTSEGYASDFVRKACMELCSFFGQVIQSSFSQYGGAHRRGNYVGYLDF